MQVFEHVLGLPTDVRDRKKLHLSHLEENKTKMKEQLQHASSGNCGKSSNFYLNGMATDEVQRTELFFCSLL